MAKLLLTKVTQSQKYIICRSNANAVHAHSSWSETICLQLVRLMLQRSLRIQDSLLIKSLGEICALKGDTGQRVRSKSQLLTSQEETSFSCIFPWIIRPQRLIDGTVKSHNTRFRSSRFFWVVGKYLKPLIQTHNSADFSQPREFGPNRQSLPRGSPNIGIPGEFYPVELLLPGVRRKKAMVLPFPGC